jgi:COP9 signalosome complex subunit 4
MNAFSSSSAGAEWKVGVWMRIVGLLLEAEIHEEGVGEDFSVTAEIYLNRASLIIHELSPSASALILSFKVNQARILDLRFKFIEAAQKYYELSVGDALENHGEKEYSQTRAAICAILAPASPSRTRLLTLLWASINSSSSSPKKNDQTSIVWLVLERVILRRLLFKSTIDEFVKVLDRHYFATLSDGNHEF